MNLHTPTLTLETIHATRDLAFPRSGAVQIPISFVEYSLVTRLIQMSPVAVTVVMVATREVEAEVMDQAAPLAIVDASLAMELLLEMFLSLLLP